MSAIFISYRREDSEDSARALYESLVPRFGKDRLFMDVEAIGLGADFRRAVEKSLSDCGVFLVMIGPAWLNISAPNDSSGKRRLDNPEDTVRQEIATALKKGGSLPVIPVLIRGTSMPTADQLPDDLRDLAFRNALSLSHLDWDANVSKLANAIGPHIGVPDPDEAEARAAAAEAQVAADSAAAHARLATQAVAETRARLEASPSAPGAVRSGGLSKGLVIGVVGVVILLAAAAFYFTRGPKSGSALTVTLVRNPRLTAETGPVDVSIDDHPSGQIRFDSNGSTPFQFQVPEGEHQFTIANPQTKASCSGTFSVNSKQTKFMPRMRDNGTACALDPAL